MPKMKSKRAAVKRFKLSSSGKIVRKRANHSHILTKKTTKRKRRLRKEALVSKSESKRIRSCLLQ